MNSFEVTEARVGILQQKKRKEMDTGDNFLTVTTAKRRRQLLPMSQDGPHSGVSGWGFLGNLTVKSKTKRKMITVSVRRGQLLFDRFTNMLPRVIVCQILPNDPHVFRVASHGSVQDLMRLVVDNKASFHDHDENGWSLLHHALQNLPMLKFLIREGLDVDEVAEDNFPNNNKIYVSSPEILLYAGADPTVELEGRPMLVNEMTRDVDIEARHILYRTFCISPFALPGYLTDGEDHIYNFCQAWAESSAEKLNTEQERKTLDLLISHGYSLQTSYGRQNGLHGFFSSEKKSFSKVLERRDLLTYLVSKGADPCTANISEETPSYLAYGSMCGPCSMSRSSLLGDLWDTVLDICGYDISKFRSNYPRKASYKDGYSREIFEALWYGREDRCPYWNDKPWPEFSNEEAESAFKSTLGQGLCADCELCFTDFFDGPCDYCGICRLVFQYSCTERFDLDHEHSLLCPRSRIGYFERFEHDGQYHFRPRSCSDLNSYDEKSDYDNTSFSGDEFEEQSQPVPAETRHLGRDCEEILSEDESVGGVSL